MILLKVYLSPESVFVYLIHVYMNKIDRIYKGIPMESGTTTDKLNATYKKYCQ